MNAKKIKKIDKEIYNKGFVWSPGNFECECDKSYDVREHLDYENCKCRKSVEKLVYKLVEECSEGFAKLMEMK